MHTAVPMATAAAYEAFLSAIWSSGYSSSVTVVQWKWTEGRGGVLLDITCCGVAGLGQRGTR